MGLEDNQDRRIIALRILRCIEFTSERRMMSMVVQTLDRRIYVYTKGADLAVLPLICSLEDEKVQKTIAALESFG